jgi:hypothetical protein
VTPPLARDEVDTQSRWAHPKLITVRQFVVVLSVGRLDAGDDFFEQDSSLPHGWKWTSFSRVAVVTGGLPKNAKEHLASTGSKDRKGNRQRSQARHLFCETCPQFRERIATEEDHRDRCAATAQRAPIYVSLDVWDEVEDMTEALRKMQEEGSHTEESDEEEES